MRMCVGGFVCLWVASEEICADDVGKWVLQRMFIIVITIITTFPVNYHCLGDWILVALALGTCVVK